MGVTNDKVKIQAKKFWNTMNKNSNKISQYVCLFMLLHLIPLENVYPKKLMFLILIFLKENTP